MLLLAQMMSISQRRLNILAILSRSGTQTGSQLTSQRLIYTILTRLQAQLKSKRWRLRIFWSLQSSHSLQMIIKIQLIS
ncbi:hypothetical protein FGO68_gene6719 [Halteria grandinella]|uniref:Uncharacterized protein n=1 Tax=Halteria grandinella TaxID=5974 RepID=A0A8J8NB06_HALGN|nr:hypothetical protein FGO68_gene6719 [Halteria grandinella]